jgi:hypothetical protein
MPENITFEQIKKDSERALSLTIEQRRPDGSLYSKKEAAQRYEEAIKRFGLLYKVHIPLLLEALEEANSHAKLDMFNKGVQPSFWLHLVQESKKVDLEDAQLQNIKSSGEPSETFEQIKEAITNDVA